MAKDIHHESRYWQVTPDLLAILATDGTVLQANPAFSGALGGALGNLSCPVIGDLVHPEDRTSTREALGALRTGAPVLEFENRCLHSDGDYRWLSWHAVPEGETVFCKARDITEEKARQRRLRTREQEAQLRDHFIAVLGHDLRNPVAAIDAALRMLGRDPDTDNADNLVLTARNSVRRMTGLIDDLMDFARTRLGDGLAIERAYPQSLRPVLEQTTQEIRLANPEREIQGIFAFDDPICCDPARLAQLVSNLLANAVTHGRPGAPVRLHARDEGGDFRLSVRNEGTPIPEPVRPMLFEPFTRSDLRASQNGLGLGLFIAREIAEGHGGALTFTSDDAGTEFTFRMPRA